MDYLALSNKLKLRIGASGNDLTAVTGLTGQSARIVQWVAEAWTEIQAEREDWNFRWDEFSKSLSAGSSDYDLATAIAGGEVRLAHGRLLLVKNSDTTFRRVLTLLDKEFFDESFLGQSLSPGCPLYATMLPDGQTIRFNCTLDVDYTISGPYYTEVQVLAASSDVPELPVRYHDAIFYRALMKWAAYEEANDQYIVARDQDSRYMTMLANDQTPKVRIGAHALA